MSSIWWIRRDLRLRDNLTLQKALENPPILPVFILDPVLLNGASERRSNFLFQNLRMLDQDLRSPWKSIDSQARETCACLGIPPAGNRS